MHYRLLRLSFYVLNTNVYICDQIYQKGSYIRKGSRHTFHCHLIATSVDQQYMCVIHHKIKQSAFNHTSFPSLSDIHEGLGGLSMAS